MRNGPCPVCFDTRVTYWPIGDGLLQARVCQRCRPAAVVRR